MISPPDASGTPAARLTPERWARVRAVVEAALTLPREARPAFFDASCGDDDALRTRVARLTASCEKADENWGFLQRPAGELVAPLLVGDGAVLAEQDTLSGGLPRAFLAALADRYTVGAEAGRGGMATVYVAEDVRHGRRVALKVLHPGLGAMLGAERFLAEIRVTARLQQPNLVPLFDSGEAGGLLYYVMPFIEGATLRARLQREGQLPVAEAVHIVRTIAGALDYAHRQGVVHRDLKPENILLQDGQPLVADFGISLAVANAADSRLSATVRSLGTPQYMSPEQAAVDAAVDGRSDIYSLACVLYELLVGEPPFTGSTLQEVIARVVGETPASVRALRPSVPAHVDTAIARALSKLATDRYATAREFADALALAPSISPTNQRVRRAWWRDPARLLPGAVAIIALATAAWWVSHEPAAPASAFVLRNLIDHAWGSDVTITPDGRALVHTGSEETGRLLTLRPLDPGRPERVLAGTGDATRPFVAPGGRKLGFLVRETLKVLPIDGAGDSDVRTAWRYGNGSWIGDSVLVIAREPGLVRHAPDGRRLAVLTRPDTARGEVVHRAPLLLPGSRAVIFTIAGRTGPGALTGPLAIASLDPRPNSPAPHVLLGLTARRAIAFVQGWLLFIKADGSAIQAVRLDVARQRVIGVPMTVLEDKAGNLETGALADNGTLLYVRRPRTDAVLFVDSLGAIRPLVNATAGLEFMHPRFSPDGRRFAVGVTSAGNADVWVYDIASRTPTPLTTTGRARHPTWTPDGRQIVFFVERTRALMTQPVAGGGAAIVPETKDAFTPTVARDGRSVVYQHGPTSGPHTVWSASLTGETPPRQVVADPVSPYMPALSPDGKWLAYVSRATGREEVYARPFPGPGLAVPITDSGGTEPAWSSPGGDRIYYRTRGVVMEAVVTRPGLAVTSRRQLFRDFEHSMPHRNYDVAPDGTGFLLIGQDNPEAVIVLNWVTALRQRLKRAS